MNRAIRSILTAVLALLLGACGAIGVKPWDRDILARKSMQPDGSPSISAFHEHIYFSKEGSSGGRTFDAGGCGCN